MENIFLTDILDQPVSMRKALAVYKTYGALFSQISALKPQKILFTGMGSSHYCNIPSVIRLNEKGFSARVETASEILHYEMGAIHPDTLLVMTSQSGESGEIVEMIKRLPDTQKVLGITNDPNSTLGRRADICLTLNVAPEQAVSTRTYLASLILSDLAVSALLGEDLEGTFTKWETAVDALEDFLKDHESIQEKINTFFNYPATVTYIGRGPALCTAESAGLFTREVAKYPALAFDSGIFRHGPYEMVDEQFCAMVFAPTGATMELQVGLADAITAHGGRVVLVTDGDVSCENKNILVLRHKSVAELASPMVQIAASQFFANGMALHLGHVPGTFRQSSKITTAQ